MQISYDYYRLFYYVAKYRNFTQAANALMNSQPNVTRSIKNLESALGCTLFVRSNRGVTLTPEGEKLYAHIAMAYEQIQAGEEELSLDKSLRGGLVSIGASETALHGLLLPILRDFHKAYPGIRMRLSNHSTPQAMAALKNGLVDLAVVTSPTGEEKRFCETPLRPFREVPVAGPAFAALAGQTLSLKELAAYPLVGLGRDTKTYEMYSQLFLRQGVEMVPDVEVATADQMLPMIQNDLGIGFVPEMFVSEAVTAGTVFPLQLKESLPKRAICLVKRTDRPLSIAARELEKMLLQQAQPR